MAQPPRRAMSNPGRPALYAAGVGAVLLLVGLVGVRLCIAALGSLGADVRPATVAEAPSPDHVEGTYVGSPGAGESAVPALRRSMVWLAVFVALAALGVGLFAWGLQVGLRTGRRRKAGAPEVVGDAEGQ